MYWSNCPKKEQSIGIVIFLNWVASEERKIKKNKKCDYRDLFTTSPEEFWTRRLGCATDNNLNFHKYKVGEIGGIWPPGKYQNNCQEF